MTTETIEPNPNVAVMRARALDLAFECGHGTDARVRALLEAELRHSYQLGYVNATKHLKRRPAARRSAANRGS
jgi:hypothetical protein